LKFSARKSNRDGDAVSCKADSESNEERKEGHEETKRFDKKREKKLCTIVQKRSKGKGTKNQSNPRCCCQNVILPPPCGQHSRTFECSSWLPKLFKIKYITTGSNPHLIIMLLPLAAELCVLFIFYIFIVFIYIFRIF